MKRTMFVAVLGLLLWMPGSAEAGIIRHGATFVAGAARVTYTVSKTTVKVTYAIAKPVSRGAFKVIY